MNMASKLWEKGHQSMDLTKTNSYEKKPQLWMINLTSNNKISLQSYTLL
jgi:hypothetical protein